MRLAHELLLTIGHDKLQRAINKFAPCSLVHYRLKTSCAFCDKVHTRRKGRKMPSGGQKGAFGFFADFPGIELLPYEKKDDRPLRDFCDVMFGSLLI
ncbi:hypothetical protein [Serratia plymuthica]|uniref:hypothetical protein n=1 Tax=Serratia plymuthica TaxID=82996 RepID=UPI0007899F9E|nr:hypothetical protein [Serratia plymuthica]